MDNKKKKNMSQLIEFDYVYDCLDYQFPLFKFLEPEHAEKFLKKGEIYLPLLSQFAKSSDESLVYDEQEGSFDFSDTYNYTGRGSGAPHIPGVHIASDSLVEIKDLTVKARNRKLPDVRIYCCSKILLSESLTWALNEGKKSCVMITNPKKFRELLCDKLSSLNVSEFFSCTYTDERKADSQTDLRQFYFYKPKKYQEQHEVRMIVNSLKNKIEIPAIKDYLIEIDIKSIDPLIIKEEQECQIEHIVTKKDNSEPTLFSIMKPSGIYSPVISKTSLGFVSFHNDNTFVSPTVKNAEVGFMGGIIPMFAINETKNIQKIILKIKPPEPRGDKKP